MKRLEIDFDSELSRGLAAYNDRLAAWWCGRAANASHSRAYRNIAAYIHSSMGRAPRLIVDYACGAGQLLARLGVLFPDSRLVGFDGSAYLLEHARRRLERLGQRRTRLIEVSLPASDLPDLEAGLVIYSFPNMVCTGVFPHLVPAETAIARGLSRKRDRDGMEENPEAIYSFLTIGRLVSLDLRRLLRRGGLCIRAEYAGARREELSLLEFTRISFEEGSLDTPVDGKRPQQWFRVLASCFFRSSVIEDVYQQAGKGRGKDGGYLLTVLRAL